MKWIMNSAKFGAYLAAGVLAVMPLAAAAVVAPEADSIAHREMKLAERVRHEIVMLPYLGVFDNIFIRVEGDRVTLEGQVIRPTLRSDAGRVAARVEGVEAVDNKIEVLPLSRFDDDIRLGVLRAIYGSPALQPYAMNPRGPIRIIVKKGNVTLEGLVLREMDKAIAGIQANQVHGVFSVNNILRVENPS